MGFRFNSFFHLFLLLFGLIFLMMPIGTLAQAATLQHVASYPLNEGESAMGVTIDGTIAYLSCDFSGIKLINIADPTTPSFLGSCPTPSFARNLVVRGGYAYVADGDSGLQVVNISNPAAPTIVGNYETPGTALSVALSGDYAYLADGYSGMLVINISNPANPTLTGTYNGFSYLMGVAIVGNYAFVTANFVEPDYGQLQAIDISDPANPSFVNGANYGGGAYGVTISGNYAYMAAFSYGLGVFNISNPAVPTLVGSLDTPGSTKRIYANAGIGLLADGYSGIELLDIATNPANPVPLDSVDTFGNSSEVVLSGEYVYVANEYTLEIYRMISSGGCHYIPGDVNGPNSFTGLDITYMVRFFKGGPHPPYSCECPAGSGNTWYVSGDINGSCSFTGLDITYGVRYFKGGPSPIPCPSCPPNGR
ncbi:MAG TPA: hypothetical protein DEO84_04975 [candidate division Zixibacteria bacterium]|nr:hypothetical protein [candidate division Zixibacteria bacterium]